MPVKTLITLTAVVMAVIGVAFFLAPDQFSAFFGIHLSTGGVYLVRLLGLTFISIAIISWYIKDSDDPALLRAYSIAALVQSALGLMVALRAGIDGIMNVYGWTDSVLYGFFTLMYALYLFKGKKA